jgi:hypothetical protein
MSILYREPSIDASYQVSVQLAKKFQGKRFLEIYQSFGRKHLWKILYKECSFFPDSLTNMAATDNSCF